MRKITLLFAFLCASVMGWATQYCSRVVTTTIDYTSLDVTVTVKKLNSTIARVILDNEHITGIRTGGTFQQWGNGVWVDQAQGVANFASGWTHDGNAWYKDFEFSTYPTSGSFQIYILMDHDAGTPAVAGFTLAGVDVDAECNGGGCADSENPTISNVATSDITYNSAVLTVTASDNVGVTGYVVKNGASQIASSPTSPITLTGLSAGTTYDNIKVIAKDACNNESSEYAVTSFETLARESECIGAKGHFGNPSVKKVYYQIDYVGGNAIINLRSLTGYNLDFAEVQITGLGNYAMTADGNGGYTYTINSPTVNDEWYLRFLYSDASFGGNEMTAETQSASDANIIYYKVGECTSTKIDDSNMALSSLGASALGTEAESNTPANAIDGNNNTRWSSEWDVDPQDFVLDLGQRRSFNAIQFVWYTTYTRTFDLLISDDNSTWVKIKSVDRTLENADNKEETIQLNGVYAARYIKFHGTVRGAGYGHSFREIRVIYATTPVLTTYTLSISASYCTISTGYPLTLTAKDQLGNDFPVVTTYTVTPAAAGTVTAGVYTPTAQGTATITAEGGGKSSSVTVRNEVSADLALNQPATAGHNNENAYQSNNGNPGQRWGSNGATHYNGGENPDFGDWWYVDLGAKYDISEIAIKWETARPNDYDIRVSDDATSWTNIGVFNSYPSNTDYEYYNSLSAVPGRYVGVWARDGYDGLAWGISMWDFQVFGTENVSANKYVSATASPAAGGSVTVQAGGIDVTEVPNNTEVTFSATPNSGYDFVNWTNGGVEVSTNPEYAMEITANTALVANFEPIRTAYCSTPVTDTQSRTLYLTISRTENANEYKILLEGSADNKITSDNVYVGTNLTLGNVNGESSVAFTRASGEWHVSSDGFGSAYITFTATNFRDISFINKGVDLFRDNSAGGNDLSSFNSFPDASLIKWNATCSDSEAPELATPVATALSGSSVRLAVSATDNMVALLTYSVNYKPEDDEGAGIDIEFNGTAGATTYKNIRGLSAGIRYQFSITVSDGANTSDAQVCYATPNMPTAPVPTHYATLVRSVYSDTYESALAHDFVKNNWNWITYSEQTINGDHFLVYTSDPAVQEQMPDVAWGDVGSGANAIVAKDGYNDGTNTGLDVRSMAYIHFDVWSAIATIYPEIYLNNNKLSGFQLDGSGWQSFDIALSSLTEDKLNNVQWIKFIALRTPNPEEIAIDNVYFYNLPVEISFADGATDNSDVITANADKIANVTINRTILANDGWYTLCVPFDMDADKVVEVFGNSTIAEMTGAEDRGTLIHLNFDYVNAIEAGHPYLIKPGTDYTAGDVIPGVTIKNVTPIVAGNDLMHFQGVYNATTLTEENIRFVADDDYLYSPAVGGTEMGAFRCYFTIPDASPALAPGKRAKIVMGPQTATGIENVQSSAISIQKVLRNGQLLIIRDGRTYSAQGIMVKSE